MFLNDSCLRINPIQWCVYVQQPDTHVAVVVQQVVCEFEFIKGDDLLHPLGAFGRGVRVIVDSARRGGVSFTGNQPRRAVEGVPGRGTTYPDSGHEWECSEIHLFIYVFVTIFVLKVISMPQSAHLFFPTNVLRCLKMENYL